MTDKNNNSGYGNSGACNSGNRNSGDYNSGYGNSGNYNSGACNSGYGNSGDRNSGYGNSGYCNSGDYNSGNYNSGYFNSNTPKVRLFNKDTDLDFHSDLIIKMRKIIFDNINPILTWVYSENMSDEEKKHNPTHQTTGGYLKEQDYKYCWQKGWEKMDKEDKEFIQSLPNFDWDIFTEITGIKREKEKKKITFELTQDQIDKIQDILKD